MMGCLHLFLYCVNTSVREFYRCHFYGDGMFGPVIPLVTGIISLKVERNSLKLDSKKHFPLILNRSKIGYIIDKYQISKLLVLSVYMSFMNKTSLK